MVKQIQYKSNKNDLDVDGFSSIVVLYQVMVFWGLCFSDNESVSFAKSNVFHIEMSKLEIYLEFPICILCSCEGTSKGRAVVLMT